MRARARARARTMRSPGNVSAGILRVLKEDNAEADKELVRVIVCTPDI